MTTHHQEVSRMDVIARCPTCGWIENATYASDGRCRGVPHPHPVAWLEQVEVVPASQLRGAVDRAEKAEAEVKLLREICRVNGWPDFATPDTPPAGGQ